MLSEEDDIYFKYIFMFFYYFLLYNNYVKIRVPFTNNNCVVYTNVLSQKYYSSTIIVTLGRRYLSILGLFINTDCLPLVEARASIRRSKCARFDSIIATR